MATVMLSPHFSLAEATTSDTAARQGIDNTPPQRTVLTMQLAAQKLEEVRALLGVPMHINSWFRCPQLNTAVGSSSTSQHPLGEAIDFIAPQFGEPLEICRAIIAAKDRIQFDQLILEHTWVHISFSILHGAPKYQVLSLLSSGHYASGLTNKDGVPYEP